MRQQAIETVRRTLGESELTWKEISTGVCSFFSPGRLSEKLAPSTPSRDVSVCSISFSAR